MSRREVRQLLQDLWEVWVSLGAVVRQEQAQRAALLPVIEQARAVVQEADAVNMDETGWRQERHRAWLWTVVTATLTIFHIDPSRGGAAVEALLGAEFGGAVGSDRWSAYNRFPAERRALCYARLKRDFQGLVDRGGGAQPIGSKDGICWTSGWLRVRQRCGTARCRLWSWLRRDTERLPRPKRYARQEKR